MIDAFDLKVEMFSQPSGSVRGIATLIMPIVGKAKPKQVAKGVTVETPPKVKFKRIAHATFFVSEAPSIVLDVPKNLTLDQIDAVAEQLKAFAAKVREVDQG